MTLVTPMHDLSTQDNFESCFRLPTFSSVSRRQYEHTSPPIVDPRQVFTLLKVEKVNLMIKQMSRDRNSL